MAKRQYHWLLWLIILLISTLIFLPGADWDNGFALHPDERYLIDISRDTTVFGNPCKIDAVYPYGHLPLLLLQLFFPQYSGRDPLFAARLLNGLFCVLLVAITGTIGTVIVDKYAGWGAACAICFAPLIVQNAHFFTVDILASTAATLAILAAIKTKWRICGIAGAAAVACKISLIWLWPVIIVFFIYRQKILMSNIGLQHIIMNVITDLAGWGAVFYLFISPWTMMDFACWSGPLLQAGIVSGQIEVPYTLQYAGTIPYLYPIVQMAIWGLGPFCTLAGIVALVGSIVNWRRLQFKEKVSLVWVVGYGVVQGGLYVKFPRYMLPLYPFIAIYANKGVKSLFPSRSQSKFRLLNTFICLFPTIICGIAQAFLYQTPHPWIQASHWIAENVQKTSTIAVEEWEHPLPLLVQNQDGFPDITLLPVYAAETPEKFDRLRQTTDKADVIIIASRRGYGALSRNPFRYTSTIYWYKQIFSTRESIVFTKCPQIGGISFSDDALGDSGLPDLIPFVQQCKTDITLRLPRLDESFRVYDSPMVVILKRSE